MHTTRGEVGVTVVLHVVKVKEKDNELANYYRNTLLKKNCLANHQVKIMDQSLATFNLVKVSTSMSSYCST